MSFTHLHVHTQYSILDGMSDIGALIKKCQKFGMNALAITDHGNMFGIKEFHDKCMKINDGKNPGDEGYFKPIFGVEAYVAKRKLTDHDSTYKEINPINNREIIVDASGYHLILLAKNSIGYDNLCKMISIAWVDGNYYRPRIDHQLLAENHEGLICCSACLGGEVAQLIMRNEIDKARECIMWHKNIFGDDYYLEIQRHRTDKLRGDQNTYLKQVMVNEVILKLATETNTKVIATNDVHFVDEDHADAHEMLICLSTGKDIDDPSRMCYTKQEWLKTPEEMQNIFSDIPEVLDNTQEIADKIEVYSLERPPIMPVFEIPSDFGTEEEYRKKFTEEDLFNEFTRNEKGEVVMSEDEAKKKVKKLGGYDRLYRIKLEGDYLRKLTLDGAKKRYGDPVPDDIMEILNFELHIMKTMGFPGYFLIVQDFIMAARNMGVSVGPGRGSAAGSTVAYCLQITDIDPLKYDLLFERFLNPDRISLPDIDIDFDDDGRAEVLRWVTKKYGADRVAHIVTFGAMATKSSIKDVARILKVPLSKVNEVTKLIPTKFSEDQADPTTGKIPKVTIENCIKYIPEIQELDRIDDEMHEVFKYAKTLEGTVRQTGIHACGVIIGADDLKKFAPLSTAKDKQTKEELLVTEYEGSLIESVGLIKMDFLGLKTLSIIKETLKNIKLSHGIDVDIDHIPIDDPETYKLYQEGRTVATFQFESLGMRKYLRELKPTVFEDLIAMNALYRPGPMDYIPDFIDRKLGRKPITYDIDCMEKYLKDTYGITVYQEQVMLLSRQLASFTRGESDTLRKAMGKKLKDKLDHLKPKFISQGTENGHDPQVLEKIWADWEKFASYAFNKSHATCYSWVAYQTAYLKAHYPAEFIAGNLTRNLGNASDIEKLMAECKNMRLDVKGPDINESQAAFAVNKEGVIRFGLAAIKGTGTAAIDHIIAEREANGPYISIYDFMERINTSKCNRKTMESLIWAGAFDCFKSELNRQSFFAPNAKGDITLDALIIYGERFKADKNQMCNSLFGDLMEAPQIERPSLGFSESISNLEILNKEKDLLGIFLSGHPLDAFRNEILYGCTTTVDEIKNMIQKGEHTFTVGGMITSSEKAISKNGKPYGRFTIEDYSGQERLVMFGKNYIEYSKYLIDNMYVQLTMTIQKKGADYKYGNQSNELECVVKSIRTLDEARGDGKSEGLLKDVTITISMANMETVRNDLNSLFEKYSGTSELRFRIIDPEIHANILLRSLRFKVDATSIPFITELEAMQASNLLSFTINNKSMSITSSEDNVDDEFTAEEFDS